MAEPQRTKLPTETTSFVGREDELERLAALFSSGERLVTLVGPAGTGKTRLSRRFAARAASTGSLVDAVFCDLSEARTKHDIVGVVAAILDVGAVGDVASAVGHALAGRGAVLVVLDNFEQLVAFAPESVGAWLEAAPEARFLVTSRERLLLTREQCFEVPPLPVDIAARLFVDRARSVRADFTRTSANAADLDELCEHLDGMPLAIELAAARVDVLPPKALLERISAKLDLLKNRRRNVPARQATLRQALDWSWDLLDEAERRALAACSIFRGGFSLEAAEAVLLGVADRTPVDLLQTLVEKSLVRRYEPDVAPGEARFGLYESIRDYAAEKLEELYRASGASVSPGEFEARHATFFSTQGEVWEHDLRRGKTSAPFARLRLESDNLLVAFARSRDSAPGAAARAGLAAAAAVAGSVPTKRQLEILDGVVGAAETAATGEAPLGTESALLVKALLDRALACHTSGRTDAAMTDSDRALALARAIGDGALLSRTCVVLGMNRLEVGKPDEGRSFIEEGLAIGRASGDVAAEGDALRQLGNLNLKHNRLDESKASYEAALAIFESIGHEKLVCSVHAGLGVIHQWKDREADAEAHYGRALELALALGERREEGIVRTNLGLLYTDQGRLDDAEREFRAALTLQRRAGHQQFVGNTIGCLAALAQLTGRLPEAREQLSEALQIFRNLKKRRYEATALRYSGVLALEEGRPEKALADLEEAAKIADEVGDLQTFVYGALGAVLAMGARIEEAERAFGVAKRGLEGRGEPRAEVMLDVLEGFLDLARARVSGSDEERTTHLLRAEKRLEQGGQMARPGSDIRVARRLLEEATARERSGSPLPGASPRRGSHPTIDPRPTLEVGDEARWFEPAGRARIDLSKRRALRLIVKRLAEQWEAAPGTGLDIDALVACGWPGEKIQTEAAASRCYTAVKTLREAGLHDVLLRHDDGYLFDTGWRIVRAPH